MPCLFAKMEPKQFFSHPARAGSQDSFHLGQEAPQPSAPLSHLSLASTPPPPNQKKMLWLGAPFGHCGWLGAFFFSCSSLGSLPPIHPTLCLTLAELGFVRTCSSQQTDPSKQKFSRRGRKQRKNFVFVRLAYASTRLSLRFPRTCPGEKNIQKKKKNSGPLKAT